MVKRKSKDTVNKTPAKRARKPTKRAFSIDMSGPVPNCVLEKIFSNCTPEDLDNCKRTCKQWFHVIESEERRRKNRLPLRPVSVALFESNQIDTLVVTSLKTGQHIIVDHDTIRKQPDFRVFTNVIVPEMDAIVSPRFYFHTKLKLKLIYELAGDRIPVRTFNILTTSGTNFLGDFIQFKSYFLKYVDAETLVISLSYSAFNHLIQTERDWRTIDFGLTGPNVKIDVVWYVHQERVITFYPLRIVVSMGDVYKKFFSCNKLGSANRLSLALKFYRVHLQKAIYWVLEGFRHIKDPSKYFKSLKLMIFREKGLPDAMEGLPEQYGFILGLQKGQYKFYWMAHPKHKGWGLVAKKSNYALEFTMISYEIKDLSIRKQIL